MQKRYLILPFVFLALSVNAGQNKQTADFYYKNAIQLHGLANLEVVFEQYARSAELGNPFAQYNIAMMYSNGESVYVDYQQAVYWFQKSAQQKFSPAQYRLGEMYYFEKGGLPRDLGKAIELFTKAAEQNDADAQVNLAILSGSGEGMALDIEQSLFWFNKAISGGHELADYYRQQLIASVDGRFTSEHRQQYWRNKAIELGILGTTNAADNQGQR